MDGKPIQSEVNAKGKGRQGFRLSPMQVAMIEEAIGSVGAFGEVALVVDKGRLHFITAKKSFNAHKYQPGMIGRGDGG